MDLSLQLTPGSTPAGLQLDVFPDWHTRSGSGSCAELFRAHAAELGCDTAADFWTGLLNPKLGRFLWKAARLPETGLQRFPETDWERLAHAAQTLSFHALQPMGWKQAQVTGGGLSLTELEPDFQFKGCPGLYFVGETLDCTGRCGGYNLHWAFGSGLAAGRSAAAPKGHLGKTRPGKKGASAPRKKKK